MYKKAIVLNEIVLLICLFSIKIAVCDGIDNHVIIEFDYSPQTSLFINDNIQVISENALLFGSERNKVLIANDDKIEIEYYPNIKWLTKINNSIGNYLTDGKNIYEYNKYNNIEKKQIILSNNNNEINDSINFAMKYEGNTIVASNSRICSYGNETLCKDEFMKYYFNAGSGLFSISLECGNDEECYMEIKRYNSSIEEMKSLKSNLIYKYTKVLSVEIEKSSIIIIFEKFKKNAGFGIVKIDDELEEEVEICEGWFEENERMNSMEVDVDENRIYIGTVIQMPLNDDVIFSTDMPYKQYNKLHEWKLDECMCVGSDYYQYPIFAISAKIENKIIVFTGPIIEIENEINRSIDVKEGM